MKRFFYLVIVVSAALFSCGEPCETCTSTTTINNVIVNDLTWSEEFCGDELEAQKYNEGTNSDGEKVITIICE